MWSILLTLLVMTCIEPHSTETIDLAKAVENSALSQNKSDAPITPTTYAKSNEPCTTNEGAKGVCIVYYNCEYSLERHDLIDLHFREDPCESVFDVCCGEIQETPTLDPVLESQNNETKGKGCGFQNIKGVGFNINIDLQDVTEFGEFPWTIAIYKIESATDTKPEDHKHVYIGGGSLIHPSVVLTAAHVVKSETKLFIRAGDWDVLTTKEIYAHQDREVETILMHKDYDKKKLYNAVSLLFLKSPIDLAPNVGLACLPEQGRRATDGDRCLITGWRKEQFERNWRNLPLQKKVEVPVIGHDVCEMKLRRTRLSKRFRLHDTFMCAGGERDKDICVAAAGSPLLCPLKMDKDRYILNGMVAWSIGCGVESDVPGAFVDVAMFRSWIDDEVAKRGYDKNTYDATVT